MPDSYKMSHSMSEITPYLNDVASTRQQSCTFLSIVVKYQAL
jgi:hypothetical protein